MLKYIVSVILLALCSAIHGQVFIAEYDDIWGEVYDLTGQQPIDLTGYLEIYNNSPEEYLLTIESVAIDIPPTWGVSESDFSYYEVEDYIFTGGDIVSVDPSIFLFTDQIEDVDTAYQTFQISAKDLSGSILQEESVTIAYQLIIPTKPTPTFQILDFEGVELADTIYIPLEIQDPFNRDFFSLIEFIFEDFWYLERPIVWEPIEYISENIEFVECQFHDPYLENPDATWCQGETMSWTNSFINFVEINGQLGQANDYRYEVLVNIYDPADPIGSSQQVRFIAADAECVYGYEADIITNPQEYIYVCAGEEVTLQARAEYSNVNWHDQSGNIISGYEVTYTDIQENVYISVSAQDEEGCNVRDFLTILLETQTATIVQTPNGNNNIEACEGQILEWEAIDGYEDVAWYNQNTGDLFYGDTYTYTVEEEYVTIEIRAAGDDGCMVVQYINIYANPMGQEADIIVGDNFLTSCLGGIIELSAKPEYTEVTWTVENTGEIYTGSLISITDVNESLSILVTAQSANNDCSVFQYVSVNVENLFANDLVDGSDFPICEGNDLLLISNPSYTAVTWENQNTGLVTMGNELILEEVTSFINIVVRGLGSDGCTYEQYLNIYPEEDLIYDEDILESEQMEYCRIVNLEASSDYTNYEWHVYNFDNNEFEILGTDRTIEIDYTYNLDVYSPLITLRGTNSEGCRVEFTFEFPIKFPEERDLIDLSALDEDCSWEEVTISTLEPYKTYRWEYQNQYYYDNNLVIQNTNDPVVLLALDGDGCSFIDSYNPTENYLGSPKICVITTDETDNHNVVLWEDPIENSENIAYYKILREGNTTNVFDSIGITEVAAENSYNDLDADNQQQAYRYQVVSVDKCNNESEPSDIHKTIHLTINLGTNDNVNLIWDQYAGITYDQIRILRGSSQDDLEELVVLPSTALSFTDQESVIGDVYYQIEITTQVDCDLGRRLVKISSNIAGFLSDSTDEFFSTFSVYPNPVGEILYLDSEQNLQVTIIDTAGKLYSTNYIRPGLSQLLVSDLAPGIYLLELSSKDGQRYKKFIKR